MKCKLCLKVEELVKKSHIIPDFMYSELYDDNHQFIFTKQEWLKGERVSRRSSGEYDSGLLCYKCENERLSSLESYARIALYGGDFSSKNKIDCRNFKTEEGLSYTHCENINYTKFKLFLLSILWRASISNREIFSEVELGSHEEEIRKMIFNESPGKINEYPILMFGTQRQSSNFSKLITQPRKLKQGVRTLYLFFIGGTILLYNISRHKIPNIFIKHTIRPSNELELIHLPKESIDVWFQKVYGLKNITNYL